MIARVRREFHKFVYKQSIFPLFYDYPNKLKIQLRAITSVGAKFFPFCTSKTYFFYFTHSFLQNTHISLSILQDILIKYYFFSIFLLLFLTTFTYTRPLFISVSLFLLIHSFFSIPISLPLSTDHLSLSLFYLLSFFLKNNQPNRPIHQPRRSEFFTTQKLPTQWTDPRTFHSFS